MKNHIMKSLLLFAVAVVLSVVGLASCTHNYAPEPDSHVVVLKFKKSEYKDKILATYMEEDSTIVATRFNRCGRPTGRSGYSPFWELPNEWLLVDWKWFNFPYMTALVLLPERTWDRYPFETSPLPRWKVSEEPYISGPIDKILYIKTSNLANYSNTTFPVEVSVLVSGQLTMPDDSICFCEAPERADHSWEMLQKCLSIAIENGDLEHINDDKYAPSR